jgi:hypothetical protein
LQTPHQKTCVFYLKGFTNLRWATWLNFELIQLSL